MTGGLDATRVGDPARYVDPTTGTVLVRYVNEFNDGVGFNFDLTITGDGQ